MLHGGNFKHNYKLMYDIENNLHYIYINLFTCIYFVKYIKKIKKKYVYWSCKSQTKCPCFTQTKYPYITCKLLVILLLYTCKL